MQHCCSIATAAHWGNVDLVRIEGPRITVLGKSG